MYYYMTFVRQYRSQDVDEMIHSMYKENVFFFDVVCISFRLYGYMNSPCPSGVTSLNLSFLPITRPRSDIVRLTFQFSALMLNT